MSFLRSLTRPPGRKPPAPFRPRTLAALATAVAAAAAYAVMATTPATAAGTTLKAAASADGGRYFGTELTGNMVNNSTITNLAATQFDMVTPGNEMKWDATEPSNGSYNFSGGDGIVSFASSHGMQVRGHNLVWQNQLPSWVSSLPTNQVQAAMEAHITTEVSHFKGKVYSWDVVNEPFNGDGSLVSDPFYKAMGSGYIADALRTAHAADPNAKLYLNDYSIEGENAKSNAMYSLAQSLLSQGVPLNGIGFESHFILGQVPSDMQANMQRFASLGLDVAVTELDDRITLPASTANLAQQATDFANVVKDCLGVTRCVGVSQWGVGDADSWVPGTFSGQGAATMFDQNYQPKPAYNAVVTALGGSAVTPPPTSSAPPSSAPPSSAPPTTGAGGPCSVADVVSAWNTGLTEQITIKNTGTTTVNGWKLTFTLASGQTITQAWNATITPSSGAVAAVNLSYNGTIAPGGTASFGFQANHTGNTAAPTGFALNGASCTSG
jgi:endo-1,4-beta-xylanase